MKRLLAPATVIATLFAAVPAQAATLLDFSVYSAGNARISGGSYGQVASTGFTNGNGAAGTNLTGWSSATDALTAAAAAASADLAARASTGTLTAATQWNPEQGILTGTGNGINVFNIAADDWRRLNTLVVNGPGTGVVINILGEGAFTNWVNVGANWRGDALNRFSADQVVLNFVDATAVSLNGWTVNGTVLAPKAALDLQGGSIAGSVIAGSFASDGATIGGNGFAGLGATATPPVPEPGTWAMLILGVGLVGAAMRRRRAAGRLAAA